MNNLVRYIAKDGCALVSAIDSTEIVRRCERLHITSATATAALGRLLSASALMAANMKNDSDKLTVRVNGGGSIGSLCAACDTLGRVRGYCDFPRADEPINPKNNKLNVGALVGASGELTVIRSNAGGVVSSGTVPLVCGEIAEDITAYYAHSEQIPTACALGVLVNPDLTVSCAGGFLLQLLPGTDDETAAEFERRIAEIPSVTNMLSGGMNQHDMAKKLLEGFGADLLDEAQYEYRCDCSRERMRNVLISLGAAELERLCDEQDSTEIVCSYCEGKYVFSREEMLELIGEAK